MLIYGDLNKACPKDDFPLPHIDLLIDRMARHEMVSLTDLAAGYNQILMHEPDKEKMSFHHRVGHLLLSSYAFWFEERWGNLSKNGNNSLP